MVAPVVAPAIGAAVTGGTSLTAATGGVALPVAAVAVAGIALYTYRVEIKNAVVDAADGATRMANAAADFVIDIWKKAHSTTANNTLPIADPCTPCQAKAIEYWKSIPLSIIQAERYAKELGDCVEKFCPKPKSLYRGGAHLCTANPPRDDLDSHHMPAKAYSPLPAALGPAIQMDLQDHRDTSSYGKRVDLEHYEKQRNFLAYGSYEGFLAAFAIDSNEVEKKYPGKYTEAIKQAREYAECIAPPVYDILIYLPR